MCWLMVSLVVLVLLACAGGGRSWRWVGPGGVQCVVVLVVGAVVRGVVVWRAGGWGGGGRWWCWRQWVLPASRVSAILG